MTKNNTTTSLIDMTNSEIEDTFYKFFDKNNPIVPSYISVKKI